MCFIGVAPDPSRTIVAASFRRCACASSIVPRNSSMRWASERHYFLEKAPLERIVACKLAQPRQCRCKSRGSFLEIGLEIRQRRRKIATLRAFGAAQLQLNERYLVFDFNGVDDPARILPCLVDQIDRTGADNSQHNDARRKQQDGGARPRDTRVRLLACARTPRRLRRSRRPRHGPCGHRDRNQRPGRQAVQGQRRLDRLRRDQPARAAPCISPLHTHFVDGVLHTELKENQFNTLGEFFTEWDVRLNRRCVGGYCKPAAAITIYVVPRGSVQRRSSRNRARGQEGDRSRDRLASANHSIQLRVRLSSA